jgi:hypothetical protein
MGTLLAFTNFKFNVLIVSPSYGIPHEIKQNVKSKNIFFTINPGYYTEINGIRDK